MMMQNLIDSVFKTVNTVEEGVRLLHIFIPLSTRKVRYIYIFLFISLYEAHLASFLLLSNTAHLIFSIIEF